jgi:SAM-dependent methyltransferase
MALYDSIGRGYAALRRPDPRIAAAVNTALGDAVSVVNVGAGAGSYEPPPQPPPTHPPHPGRSVLAVEPSEVMIRQRPPGAAPCLQGSAEALPLDTGSVDAAMAILSAHHWTDLHRGLSEMARVARKRVVLLTWVPPPDSPPFWLTEDYFPEILAHDRTIFPSAAALTAMLERVLRRGGPGRAVRMTTLPIPHDCTDGFLCAYWRRPECYLSAERRSVISSFARIDAEPGLAKLRADLANGRWLERNRRLLARNALDVGYRIVCGEIG